MASGENSVENDIAIVVLNRPEAMRSVDSEVRTEPQIRVAIVNGKPRVGDRPYAAIVEGIIAKFNLV